MVGARFTRRDYSIIADVLHFVIVGENPFLEAGAEEDWITTEELKAVLEKVERREESR